MSTREQILHILTEAGSIPISGETLAGKLGISRAAVHKNINLLRMDGYEISASTNKGYCLAAPAGNLITPGINSILPDSVEVHFYKTVDSTNTVARKMAIEGAPGGTVVIANHQTGGRGRLGRSFHAPAGAGIYMSIILRPDFDISKSMMVTTASSVAVCRGIRKVCGVDPSIKWVNDIYLNNRKICGILTEATTDFETGQIDSLIVGIGINRTTENFPEELSDIAGALEGDYSSDELAACIITELLDLASELDPDGFIDEYRERSLVLGKTITVHKGGIRDGVKGVAARALDIDNTGSLVVLYSSGEQESLSSGEISIRLGDPS